MDRAWLRWRGLGFGFGFGFGESGLQDLAGSDKLLGDLKSGLGKRRIAFT